MLRLNSKQLRNLTDSQAEEIKKSIKRNPLYFILEDIYDTYNVGSFFRLGEALAVEKIYLCGETETPPNTKVKRAAVGTDKIVPWVYKKDIEEAIKELNEKGVQIVAVEQAPNSVLYTKAEYKLPVALVLGNETRGVSEKTLKLSDLIVEIPMFGVNKSLNVLVAASVVAFWIVKDLGGKKLY